MSVMRGSFVGALPFPPGGRPARCDGEVEKDIVNCLGSLAVVLRERERNVERRGVRRRDIVVWEVAMMGGGIGLE
jgi:hypothetical protein